MMPRDLPDAILLCDARGWATIPVPPGEKRAVTKGWNSRHFELLDFDPLGNIGIRWGADSGGLVDVDLDCCEALELADIYLPATQAIFGRPSKPRSHRLYVAPAAVFEAFADPVAKDTLLQLRADGATGGRHQTIVPPSVAGGERREWWGDTIEPDIADPRVLRRRVAWLAIGCLTLRYISEHAARCPGPDLPRILWEADHVLGRAAYQWIGEPAPDAPRRYPRRRAEQDPRDIDLAALVAAIPNNCGWEDWNRIGLAIYAAAKDRGDGQVIFDDFSSRSPKYQAQAVEERWRNYGRSPPNRIGLGSLVHMARQAGWRPPREASHANRR
jgi:Primase C terminal 2 (PriCT-2)/Bifunctional DNA primase/polymerase, N-terminal